MLASYTVETAIRKSKGLGPSEILCDPGSALSGVPLHDWFPVPDGERAPYQLITSIDDTINDLGVLACGVEWNTRADDLNIDRQVKI